MIYNIVSLSAALLALAVSVWIALRQSLIMKHANEMPILIETIKEYRSSTFQQHEHYVATRLDPDNSSVLGLAELPEEARIAATSLVTFFNIVGLLLVHGIADEPAILTLFGYRADAAWATPESYILQERRNRPDDLFAGYFEDMVTRVRAHRTAAARRLNLRKLEPSV